MKTLRERAVDAFHVERRRLIERYPGLRMVIMVDVNAVGFYFWPTKGSNSCAAYGMAIERGMPFDERMKIVVDKITEFIEEEGNLKRHIASISK